MHTFVNETLIKVEFFFCLVVFWLYKLTYSLLMYYFKTYLKLAVQEKRCCFSALNKFQFLLSAEAEYLAK